MDTIQVDGVIAEVWAIRDRFAARAGHDVGVMFQRIREMQNESGREYTTYPSRPIRSTDESD